MILLNTTNYRLMSIEEASTTAAEMNADIEDDWTYTAVHDPKGTGYSFVEARDEDGEFVARI